MRGNPLFVMISRNRRRFRRAAGARTDWRLGFVVKAATAAMALVLAGCASNGAGDKAGASDGATSHTMSYGMTDDEFDRGAGKLPTAATMYSLARILAAQGRTGESISVLRNVIQQYPGYSPAYNALAEGYLATGRTDQAIVALSAGLTRAPDDPILLNNFGMILFLQGRYDEAIGYFERAVEVRPGDSVYRANNAAALGMLGRAGEAETLYRQFLPPLEVQENLDILDRARRNSRSRPPVEALSTGAAPAPSAAPTRTSPAEAEARSDSAR